MENFGEEYGGRTFYLHSSFGHVIFVEQDLTMPPWRPNGWQSGPWRVVHFEKTFFCNFSELCKCRPAMNNWTPLWGISCVFIELKVDQYSNE